MLRIYAIGRKMHAHFQNENPFMYSFYVKDENEARAKVAELTAQGYIIKSIYNHIGNRVTL